MELTPKHGALLFIFIHIRFVVLPLIYTCYWYAKRSNWSLCIWPRGIKIQCANRETLAFPIVFFFVFAIVRSSKPQNNFADPFLHTNSRKTLDSFGLYTCSRLLQRNDRTKSFLTRRYIEGTKLKTYFFISENYALYLTLRNYFLIFIVLAQSFSRFRHIVAAVHSFVYIRATRRKTRIHLHNFTFVIFLGVSRFAHRLSAALARAPFLFLFLWPVTTTVSTVFLNFINVPRIT